MSYAVSVNTSPVWILSARSGGKFQNPAPVGHENPAFARREHIVPALVREARLSTVHVKSRISRRRRPGCRPRRTCRPETAPRPALRPEKRGQPPSAHLPYLQVLPLACVPKQALQVHRSIEHGKAFFSGLQVCASVWLAPSAPPRSASAAVKIVFKIWFNLFSYSIKKASCP